MPFMPLPSPSRLSLLLALLIAAFIALPASADATLDKIKQRGKISVGISPPAPPLGVFDPATGKTGGYQAELAADIARRLGAELETVVAPNATRVQLLQSGKIDLLIAAFGWTPEREAILSFAPTPYDLVGGGALVPENSAIKRWEDLKGKAVCMSQGSSYGKLLSENYGAVVKGFRSRAESVLALKGGVCDAAIHDYPELYAKLHNDTMGEWSGYRLATRDQLNPTPIVVWMRKGEADTQAFVDQVVQDWHRSGFVLEQARKWGMDDAWVAARHDRALQGRFDRAPYDFEIYQARPSAP